MDLFKLLMNFKLSTLPSSGAGITNCGVGGGRAWAAGPGSPVLSWGTAHLLSGSPGSNDQLLHLLKTSLPQVDKLRPDQSPKHQTRRGVRGSPMASVLSAEEARRKTLRPGPQGRLVLPGQGEGRGALFGPK